MKKKVIGALAFVLALLVLAVPSEARGFGHNRGGDRHSRWYNHHRELVLTHIWYDYRDHADRYATSPPPAEDSEAEEASPTPPCTDEAEQQLITQEPVAEEAQKPEPVKAAEPVAKATPAPKATPQTPKVVHEQANPCNGLTINVHLSALAVIVIGLVAFVLLMAFIIAVAWIFG